MDKYESSFWMALTDLNLKREKINTLLAKIKEKHILISELEKLKENDALSSIKNMDDNLAKYETLVDELAENRCEIISSNDLSYPKRLHDNLGDRYSPPVLFIRGNRDLLKKDSIAIVGSRNASEKAMVFTDNVAKLAASEDLVVVSGFAKGVDRQALDSALKYKAKSIIVLPQGILTFENKSYERQIASGDVVVLSIYPPKAPWNVGYAMDRNSIIYGLASEIYVAESGNSGGTWSGVHDALKHKNRKVYIRKPDVGEKNANAELLALEGAIAVDMNGKVLKEEIYKLDSQTELPIVGEEMKSKKNKSNQMKMF